MDFTSVFTDLKTHKQYILMEARTDVLFKSPDEYKVIDRFPGKALKDLEYEPLFDYFIEVGRGVMIATQVSVTT